MVLGHDGGRLVPELVRRLDHHIGRACDEVMRLQQPIDRSLGDKILTFVSEPHGSSGQNGIDRDEMPSMCGDVG